MRVETADDGRDDAVIISAEIVAGHDGEAELDLRLRYKNGIVGHVVVDAVAGFRLMRNCGVDNVAALAGHGWRRILGE